MRKILDQHLAFLAERAGDQTDGRALRHVLGHRHAVVDRLVVGMRMDQHEPPARRSDVTSEVTAPPYAVPAARSRALRPPAKPPQAAIKRPRAAQRSDRPKRAPTARQGARSATVHRCCRSPAPSSSGYGTCSRDGGLAGLGTSPVSTICSRALRRVGSGMGTADSRAWVYGWVGRE